MGLLGRRPRPARGSAQSPAWLRRPRDPGLRASSGGWGRGLQLCRRGPERGRGATGGAAWQLLLPERPWGGGRLCTCVCRPAARPLGGPHPPPASACAEPTRRVCAATQLARGPRPPRRGPGRKTLPSHPARGGSGGSSSA